MALQKYVLPLCFFVIFLFLGINSFLKYLRRSKAVSIEEIELSQKEFPSVTICPNYAFKEILEVEMFQGNSSLDEIESRVKRNVWTRNETFYFVDFPTRQTPGFPCLTTEESIDPNKPCMFPFIYKKKAYSNCTTTDAVDEYCYTKDDKNGTIDIGIGSKSKWGLCRRECAGEVFLSSHPANLANYHTFWTTDIYDLRTWYDGFCHTFHPPDTQDVSSGRLLGLYLGHDNIPAFTTSIFSEFILYIHTKGAFWPGNVFINQEKVNIPPNVSVEVKFQPFINEKLDDEKCIADPGYSWTDCVLMAGAESVGCSLNWFRPLDLPVCSTLREMRDMQAYFNRIKTSSVQELLRTTGCHLKCSSQQFKVMKTTETEMAWINDWVSEVFLDIYSVTMERRNEYYTYDANDLLGGIGGYMGMFLGWSFLSILTFIHQGVFNVRNWSIFKTKSKKQKTNF